MTSLQTFMFVVRDATDGSHEVTFVRHSAGHLSAHCTCQEPGDAERSCEHCLALLAGDTTDLLSGNEVEVEVLEWWLACMDLKQTVTRVQEAQEAGRVPPATMSSVFAHWPDLAERDFSFEGAYRPSSNSRLTFGSSALIPAARPSASASSGSAPSIQ